MADFWPTIYQFIYEWQTLIAGIFAIIAGIITVRGTRRTAQMQINETRRQRDEEEDRRRTQNELACAQDRRFINEKLSVLYKEIEQKIRQIGSNPNSHEQIQKPTLEEIRRIPFLEMQGVEEKIARLDPPTVYDFTKLIIDMRIFNEYTSSATIVYVHDRLKKFLGQIEKIRSRILFDYDA